jgi:hypothetical protein
MRLTSKGLGLLVCSDRLLLRVISEISVGSERRPGESLKTCSPLRFLLLFLGEVAQILDSRHPLQGGLSCLFSLKSLYGGQFLLQQVARLRSGG